MEGDVNGAKCSAGGGEQKPDLGRRWVNVILGSGVIATITAFVYPAIRYVIPPPVSESTNLSVVAAKVGELKDNSAKVFKFGSSRPSWFAWLTEITGRLPPSARIWGARCSTGLICTKSGARAITAHTICRAAMSAVRLRVLWRDIRFIFKARTLSWSGTHNYG